MISQESISELRLVAKLSEFIGNTKRVGTNYVCKCPVHKEKTASLSIPIKDDNFAKCFGCGFSGDVFEWAMKMNSLSFPDAVRFVANHFNFALEEDDLHFSGNISVRHLMEVFVQDVGFEEIKAKVSRPLKDLKVATYYGCQILRPRKDHEETEQPVFFEDLMSAIGATPVDFPEKVRCCSGALIITNRKAALSMVRNLMMSAIKSGADVIATACPMCQVNLECYQKQVNQEFGIDLSIPVLYFTQLTGLAFGIAPNKLRIGTELVLPTPALSNIRRGSADA